MPYTVQTSSRLQFNAMADEIELQPLDQTDAAQMDTTQTEGSAEAANSEPCLTGVEAFNLFYQEFVGGPIAARKRHANLHWPDTLMKTALAGAGGLAATLVVGYSLSNDAPDRSSYTYQELAPSQQNSEVETSTSVSATLPAPTPAAVEHQPDRTPLPRRLPAVAVPQTVRVTPPQQIATVPLRLDPAATAVPAPIAPPATVHLIQAAEVSQPNDRTTAQVSQSAEVSQPDDRTTTQSRRSASGSLPTLQLQAAPLPAFIQAGIAPPETQSSTGAPAQAGLESVATAEPSGVASSAALPEPSAVTPPATSSAALPEPSAATPLAASDRTATELASSRSLAFRSPGVTVPETAAPQSSTTDLSASLKTIAADQGIHYFLNLSKPGANRQVLPLSDRAAVEVAQAENIPAFRVFRLSHLQYQQVWLAAQSGETSLPTPARGFIDYQQQMIVLPADA